MKTGIIQKRDGLAGTAGFTLIEILVVIVIITILASVVTINVLHKPGEARLAAAQLQLKVLKSAVHVYRTEQQRVPTQSQGLEALVRKPILEPIPRTYPQDGYLDSTVLPLDPWGHAYIYLTPGRHGESFEIISYGRDGEPGGADEDADLSSSER